MLIVAHRLASHPQQYHHHHHHAASLRSLTARRAFATSTPPPPPPPPSTTSSQAARLVANAATSAAATSAANTAAKAALPPPPTPPRPPRRFFRSLLGYSLGLGIVFYTGSTVAAVNNDRYQDFFVESVPFGEAILDQVVRHNLDRQLHLTAKDTDVSSVTNRAFSVARSAFGSVYEAVDRTFIQTKEQSKEAEHKAKQAAQSFQERAQRTAQDAASQLSSIGQRGKESIQQGAQKVKDTAKDALSQAQAQAESLKPQKGSVADRVAVAAGDAASKVQQLGRSTANKVNAAANKAEEALPRQGQPLIALPERLNKAKKENDATVVALPERASRADQDAAAYARYRTVAAAEQARLAALQEIDRLHSQFEQLKHSEAQRAGRLLDEQEAKFKAELAKAQAELERATKKAEAELRNKDAQWTKELEQERKKAREEQARVLQESLDTQNEMIEGRLKEEVVARGIELQKKWVSGVKAAVEKERGGRLAKLEELAQEATVLEKLARENESIIKDAAGVHTLTAAVRALSSAALGGAGASSAAAAEGQYAYRTPFRAQIEALRNAAREQSSSAAAAEAKDGDNVFSAALSALEAGDVNPDEGVESESTLSAWFKRRVAPKVLSVALLPDPTAPVSQRREKSEGGGDDYDGESILAAQPRSPGVFAHLVSATLAPLLAKKPATESVVLASDKSGADDIPTLLARAEFWIDKGQLEEAVREVNRLKGWGKALAADWLVEARKRLVVQQAVE
ncbi:MICOS complex subunit mic60, partial [Tilletia horrida]